MEVSFRWKNRGKQENEFSGGPVHGAIGTTYFNQPGNQDNPKQYLSEGLSLCSKSPTNCIQDPSLSG